MVARGVVGVGLLAVVLAAAPAVAAGEDLVPGLRGGLGRESRSSRSPTPPGRPPREVLTAGGGSPGAGQVKLLDTAIAARFPAYDGAAHGARAVITRPTPGAPTSWSRARPRSASAPPCGCARSPKARPTTTATTSSSAGVVVTRPRSSSRSTTVGRCAGWRARTAP
ncbi:MAG: hypothetical protein R2734_18920 [Nocardioides sp.]